MMNANEKEKLCLFLGCLSLDPSRHFPRFDVPGLLPFDSFGVSGHAAGWRLNCVLGFYMLRKGEGRGEIGISSME